MPLRAGALAALLVALAAGAAPSAFAQVAPDSTASTHSLDARLFAAVYAVDAPSAVVVLRAAQVSSVPAILATAPVVSAVALARGETLDPGVRMIGSQVAAYVAVVVIKRAVVRPRPFRALPGVVARHGAGHAHLDPYSFPSGHTALAFALATSASLSAGEAWVVVPALGWAAVVGTTRMWHGVHYPLDVAAGAAIGTGAAVLVHALAPGVGRLGGGARGAVVVPLVTVPL